MNKKISGWALAIACISLMNSCRKDPETTPAPAAKAGSVKMEFNNVVGTDNLKMDGTVYKNQNGDDFTVTKFNYYISNLKFNKADGSSFAEAESYHLLEQSKASSMTFDIANVPAATYNSVTYTIGVDSLRNVSGAQSGALDPANGMFWSWSTGYIMLKLEGTSPQSTESGNIFMLHAGGFKGGFSVLRTITLTFPQAIVVNGDGNHIHIKADVQKILGGSNVISMGSTPVVMSAGETGKKMADNYQNMFTVTASGK